MVKRQGQRGKQSANAAIQRKSPPSRLLDCNNTVNKTQPCALSIISPAQNSICMLCSLNLTHQILNDHFTIHHLHLQRRVQEYRQKKRQKSLIENKNKAVQK